ncbi:MAG: 1,4-dihydroxy-2-naphthoate polyprenyltransferase [Chloroflexota bacterium]|jgi:1,4-dihydroxy-2-naphthoate octaprenyltransferase|nr:1,4-dihydroxy-2-naphthoate polyprenyltransferase [Chloroflexota bacterium]
MKLQQGLSRLGTFSHAVITTVGADGYPVSVATGFGVEDGAVTLDPASLGPDTAAILGSGEVHLVFSHIRPQPGVGYDERNYLELSGRLDTGADRWRFEPAAARGWAEDDIHFMELCERALPQARRYLASLSEQRATEVKPKMSLGARFFVATRLPFLTATLVPVAVGVAAAAYERAFSPWLAALTLLGAVLVHLGLNVANDVFDAISGADEANVNPTMFSGGSRVIQYGVVSLRQMVALSATFYALAAAIGVVLVLLTGTGLLWLGVAGILVSFFYTAPPLKLVHRGLGELAVAAGFGPIMVLGAYHVQTGHYGLRPLVLSIPVALMVTLILYANEIPDRVADAVVGKRTLVVRLTRGAVLRVYALAAAAAYVALAAGVVTGVLPWPTLLALATIPLAVKTARGLRRDYDNPYTLMASLQTNIVLHLTTGVCLVAGTLLGILVS